MFSLFKEKVKNPFSMWIWEGKKKNQGYGSECIQRNTGCTERNPSIANL